MALTTAQVEQFHRDGFILVPDVFTPAEMDDALAACEPIFYGKSYDEFLADIDAGNADAKVRDGFHTSGEQGRTQFPVGAPALDSLMESDPYLDMFEQCLGTRSSYCNAHLFLRPGITDSRHAANPWEGWHIDHDTNCLLPPTEQFGKYEYINSHVYLHDVEDDGAPMLVIPGSHRLNVWPHVIASDNFAGRGQIKDIRRVTGLAEPVRATARKGAALLYSSSLIHAAQPFANKRKQRVFWTLSLSRRENASWQKFANPFLYGEREHMLPFMYATSPRVRAIFGWPEAGDPYYTENTLAMLEKWHPGLDVQAYRDAMGR